MFEEIINEAKTAVTNLIEEAKLPSLMNYFFLKKMKL